MTYSAALVLGITSRRGGDPTFNKVRSNRLDVCLSSGNIEAKSPVAMTTLEERVKEILEVGAKIEAIEEKRELSTKLKDELIRQNALVATIDPDVLNMISRSASGSTEKRHGRAAVNITDSVINARKRIVEIDEEMDEAEEELELWRVELEKLQGDLDNVSLDELEQLQENKQRLEEER